MAIDITTAITGAAITGLTTPGYTMTADQAPDTNSRQALVSTLTGTQTGVTVHSISDPFTLKVKRPKSLFTAPRANPITGAVGPAGLNKIQVQVRKGTKPLVGQNPQISNITVDCNIIAGAEVNDLPNVLALYSLAIGALTEKRIT